MERVDVERYGMTPEEIERVRAIEAEMEAYRATRAEEIQDIISGAIDREEYRIFGDEG